MKTCVRMLVVLVVSCQLSVVSCFAANIKQPNVAGAFYPDNPQVLAQMIDGFLKAATPEPVGADIFALICPHAGYDYSGGVAAYGYKLIQNKPYKTVIVIGPSHQYGFAGASIYPEGFFRTPLGDLEIDKEFTQKLMNKYPDIIFEPAAFAKEHSVEVELPFLQKVLSGFKIVPIVMGDCPYSTCSELAGLLKEAIGQRKDVLVVASTDMYHGYDYDEADSVDNATLGCLKNMDAQGLYNGLRAGSFALCGGFGVVSTLILAKDLGHSKISVLKHTNSAEVTGRKVKGIWTVGYTSCAIDAPGEPAVKTSKNEGASPEKGGAVMLLNNQQRKKLLEIARKSIEVYLKTGKRLEVIESDPVLLKEMGAFVTLTEHGDLRGCIGNLVGRQPLYITIRDMAVEAATGDPRFAALRLNELKSVEIEISVLSPLEKIDDPAKIKLGTHGVLVARGGRSGVFLPQVATETGWSKEEFLSNLCAQKAGLAPDAWKDKATEIYIFTAEVFSEKEVASGG